MAQSIVRTIVFVFALFLPLVTFGQEKTRAVEDEQILQLRRPNNLTLELTTRLPELNEPSENLTRPLKQTDNIYFRLLIMNTSSYPVEILVTNPYFQNRPLLIKDGQELLYRKDVIEKLKAVDAQVDFPHIGALNLEPLTPKDIGHLKLRDWYSNLEPGIYRLMSRFRFVTDGEWISSNEITFEIQ